MTVVEVLVLLLLKAAVHAFVPLAPHSKAIHQQHQHQYPLDHPRLTGWCDSLFTHFAVQVKASNEIAPIDEGPKSRILGPKHQMIKDLMWLRDTKDDITAAEFAASLEASEEKEKKRKRAVDYGNLVTQLDRRLMDMCCVPGEDCIIELLEPPIEGRGLGTIAYTNEQRRDLFNRLVNAKKMLNETMNGQPSPTDDEDDQSFFALPEIQLENPKDVPKLYVRDDGTVDWDGALQDRSAMREFGTSVWARINGQDPEKAFQDDTEEAHAGSHSMVPSVTAKIEDTEEIRIERARLEILTKEFNEVEQEHTALLKSAIAAGQAVANINFAMLEPKLRTQIRDSSAALEQKKEEVSLQTLRYELERIYVYLCGEMNSTIAKGKVPLQDRLSVAEFGLLENQIQSFTEQIGAGDGVDSDLLQVVLDQVTDFKRRLGIDYLVAGLTFNREAILKWLGEAWEKTKEGLIFYGRGCQLFFYDIVFCLALVGRALKGYTLKPREVRNLRRTFKDIITFIPVIIILLIPLSPVGHVLVFGAIQRVFPDFFPSCFTERRQNLYRLYQSTEFSELTVKESWKEKLNRALEAVVFQIVAGIRFLLSTLSKSLSSTASDEEK